MKTIVTPWTFWADHAKNCTDDELAYIVRDCREAQVAMQGWNPEREGYYSDQAATYQMEVMKRKKG